MRIFLVVLLAIFMVAGFSSLSYSGQPDEDAMIQHLYYSGAMTGYATPPPSVPYWNNWQAAPYYYGYGYSSLYGYGYGYPNWIPYKPETQDASPYNFEVKPAGRVVIQVDPEDAEVFVDGLRLQQLPDLSYQVTLLAGKQHIDIKKEGYESFSEDVTVQPGAGLVVSISLNKKKEAETKP